MSGEPRPDDRLHRQLHPVAKVLTVVVAAITFAWTTWCGVVVWVGGEMPIFGIRVEGSTGMGILWFALIQWVVWASATALLVLPLSAIAEPITRAVSKRLPRGPA